MDRLFSHLLLLVTHCGSVNVSRRIVKDVYKPYGPKMCYQLNRKLEHNAKFGYIENDLSCRRIPLVNSRTNKHRTELERDKIINNNTHKRSILGQENCVVNINGEGPFYLLPKPNVGTKHKDGKITLCDPNINLLHIIGKGKLTMVQTILSQGKENINCQWTKGRTPVMRAARKGQEKIFDFLVSQGCDLSATDNYNDTVLHIACKGGNVNIVRKLVDVEKYDIDIRGKENKTPVMRAAYGGHVDVVKFLVAKCCYLTAVDDTGDTVLHWACHGGQVAVVKYILSTNAVWIDSREAHGRTPLLIAVASGNIDVVDLLVSRGSNLTVVNEYNNNILHTACRWGSIDMVRYILSKGLVDIDSIGQNGRTPVMMATEKGKLEVFDYLVSSGCNLRASDDKGNTVSHIACTEGHAPIVNYLIEKDAFQWVGNKQGQTPLRLAETRGNEEIIVLLKANTVV